MLRAAMFIAMFRFGIQILLGSPMGTATVFVLPEIELPVWLSGLRLGGEVTVLSIEYGAMQALRLASLVVIFAGVAAVSNPRDLLESGSSSLNKVRLFGSLTLNFLPQLSRDAERLLKANRWRGQKSNQITQISRNLIPLTETVLERAVNQGAALSIRTKIQESETPATLNRTTKVWLTISVAIVTALFIVADPILTLITTTLHVLISLELFGGWTKAAQLAKDKNFWLDFAPIFWLALFLTTNFAFKYVSLTQPTFDLTSVVGQLLVSTLLLGFPLIKRLHHA